jgi:hypothetical protein
LPTAAELSKAELSELVAQAVVDAHDRDEQMSGFYNMIEDSLALPFTTTILGLKANVEGIGLTDGGIVAVCCGQGDSDKTRLISLGLTHADSGI